MSKYWFIILVFQFIVLPTLSQQVGCTDVLANNYNSLATVNNGSCMYNATAYTPPIKDSLITDSLKETSGLQMANGYLWSFNDMGGSATLYRIDTTSGNILQRVILNGITNVDWEDIAFDGTNLYIGDFGNNLNGARTDFKIYKFSISTIPDYVANPVANIPNQQIETISFEYAGRPLPPVPTTYNNTKYDCEAMLVWNNKVHLFTKNWIDTTTTHFVINSIAAGNYMAQPVDTLKTGYLVTAADKVEGQNIIVLIGYQVQNFGNHYMHILSDYRADSFFTGNKRKLDLPNATIMGQAEGVAFVKDRYGFISNEKFTRTIPPFTINVDQKLRAFSLNDFVGNYYTKYIFTGNGNWSDANNWKYKIKPPATIISGNEIVISPIINGRCLVDVPYTIPRGAKLTVMQDSALVVNGNLVIQ